MFLHYLINSERLFIRRTKNEDLHFVLESEQGLDNKSYITPWSREQTREY
jgi:hypothetical protein